ncbi:helix-turn-helix transcriptional regulator [Mucilaginibacter sp. UR6-11]|uniref:helix-turn-helix transcriptional regulator n=1 Tax=Mucilaginibacter sp. UR6-11 TaxID=1435644 RepID=UPI00351D962E
MYWCYSSIRFFKLKPNTIYNLINKNGIPYHKKPGSNRVLFIKSELLEWLKKEDK